MLKVWSVWLKTSIPCSIQMSLPILSLKPSPLYHFSFHHGIQRAGVKEKGGRLILASLFPLLSKPTSSDLGNETGSPASLRFGLGVFPQMDHAVSLLSFSGPRHWGGPPKVWAAEGNPCPHKLCIQS